MTTQRIFQCNKCGRRFDTARGLQVHGYTCLRVGKTKPKVSRKKQNNLHQTNGKLELAIPCTLGDHAFTVSVMLGIEATSISQ